MSESSESKVEKDEKLTKIRSKVNMITKMMKTIHDDVDEIKNKMATRPEEHGLGRPKWRLHEQTKAIFGYAEQKGNQKP